MSEENKPAPIEPEIVPSDADEFQALVLVVHTYGKPKQAEETYGLTDRTIRNYKRRLREDARFARLFDQRRREFLGDHAEAIDRNIRGTTALIDVVIKELSDNPKLLRNPEMIEKITNLFDTAHRAKLADRVVTRQIQLSERLLGK